MTDFSQLAKLSTTEIQEPKPLPPGTYFGEIVGEPTWRESNEKKTPGIAFTFALKEADSDVDEDALEEYGGLTRNDGQPRTVKKDYWFIAASGNFGWDFRQLCDSLGEEGEIGEILPKLAGAEVQFTVKHRLYKGKTQVEIDNVMAREG